MLLDALFPTAAPKSLAGTIQQAADRSGTSFRYLLATAKVESNLNPQASAKTSSAGGLFQFIEQTWLETLKEAGASFGYGHYAHAIERNGNGRFEVADPALRAEILNLRKDPAANAAMAGAFTKNNAGYLARKLGRAPTDGELYIAHFLGAGGAAKLINLAAATPHASAADAFPRAADANRAIFYTPDGRPRSLAAVAGTLNGRYDVALAKTAPLAAGLATPVSPPKAESARVARAYEVAAPSVDHAATGDGSAYRFRNPYRTKRVQAAPGVVAPAAAVNNPVRVTGVAEGAKRTDLVGLFQDLQPDVRALFRGG